MSNLTHQLPPAEVSPRNSQNGYQTAVYEKEVAFKARESSNTDLVVETREGDKVTLSLNNYTELEGYMYDNRGVALSESGKAFFSNTEREITLASGQRFSFSVSGDLNEDELKDIESLLQGLDGVMGEMREGDLDGAMDQALRLGSFATVSSYSADLHFESETSIHSREVAAASTVVPAEREERYPVGDLEIPESGFGPQTGQGSAFDTFFLKLLEEISSVEQRIARHAQGPVNALFTHHLEDLKDNESKLDGVISVLEKAMEKMDLLLEQLEPDELSEDDD